MANLNKLNQLYRAVILDHSRYPKNKQTLDSATHHIELLNPTCGDILQMSYIIVDGIVEDAAFTGQGCAISMASADMICQLLKGKNVEEVAELMQQFDKLIGGSEPIDEWDEDTLADRLHDAYYLKGVRKFPARYKCGALACHATKQAIEPILTKIEEGFNE